MKNLYFSYSFTEIYLFKVTRILNDRVRTQVVPNVRESILVMSVVLVLVIHIFALSYNF